MTYRHGDDWAVGMVGGSAVRAEIKSVARCVVMIALSIVLVAGLVPLAPGYAPVAQAAEGRRDALFSACGGGRAACGWR